MKLIHIKSSDRTSGTIGNFTVDIPSSFIYCKSTEEMTISLVNFFCKRNFYNIQSYNNTFQVNENGTIRTIYINEGSPNSYNLITELLTKLNLFGSSYVYTIDYNISTLHFIFTVNNNDVQFIFNNSCAELLGFDKTTYNFTNRTLESTRIIDLNGEECIYIHLMSADSENIETSTDKTVQKSNVIGIVPLTCPTGGVIYYGNLNDDYKMTLSQKEVTKLQFKLTNEYNDELTLQTDYFMVLKIETIDLTEDNTIPTLLRRINDNLFTISKKLDLNNKDLNYTLDALLKK